jgi:hypothetical protein
MKQNPKLATRDLTIAQDRLQGLTYKQLADKYNLSKPRIHQILSKKEQQQIIEDGKSTQIALIPLADKVLYDILTIDDNKYLTHKLKAADTVYRNTGISPTHAQIQINQDNRKINLSDGIKQLLSGVSESNRDAIEGEFEEVN